MSGRKENLNASCVSVEERLVEIWCRVLDLEQIGLRDDFFQLGGDSLAAAQVMVDIQRTLGRKLPLTVLNEAPTVEALAKVINRQVDPPPWSSLVALQPLGSNLPFFCVHGVGGTVLGLRELANYFAPQQPFYGIQAAGSDGYEQRFLRVEPMAGHYVEAVRALQPHGPYYLGGFSFGGSVALEMAQQLHAQGERVALLAILDHTPPPTRYQRIVWTPSCALEFALNAVRWLLEDIWHAGSGRRLAALWSKAKVAKNQITNLLKRSRPACGKADMEEIFAGHEFPTSFQRLLEVHYQAMRDYAPKPYPGRVVLFRARVRPLFRLHGRDLGWGKLAGGGLEVIRLPGNHETILKPPNVKALAEALLLHLNLAQASCEGANGRDCASASIAPPLKSAELERRRCPE